MSKNKKWFDGDELAYTTFLNKYSHNKQETPDDVNDRMAGEFYLTDKQYQEKEKDIDKMVLSDYGQKRKDLTKDRIFELFSSMTVIPQGSVQAIVGTDIIGSASNCVVAPQPTDSYGGIFYTDQTIAQFFKRRMGAGIDISSLRPDGAGTKNVAKTSTGAVSFMHRFSHTTREVAQNNRRGALMISMDVNHPDILDFIKVKRDLTKVTGANISVKLNKEFMTALENNEDYMLRFPIDTPVKDIWWEITKEYNKLYKPETDGAYIKKVKAQEVWDELIKSAHNVAEPGIMYWDRMINFAPDSVYEEYKPISTNPCSEIALPKFDSCRLIAINFTKFVVNPFKENAYFDYDKFYKVAYETLRLGDNLVDIEAKQVQKIIDKVERDPEPDYIKAVELDMWKKVKEIGLSGRRTGIGLTGLGDMLAMLNIKYDSEQALGLVGEVMQTKMRAELDATTDLSILRGHFKGWDRNKEYKSLLQRDNKPVNLQGANDWYEFVQENFTEQMEKMWYFGRRNVSFSTVAPTGTISMLAGVTSGIEPLFMPFYTRRVKVVGDERVDFVDDTGDKWKEVPVLHRNFKKWITDVKGITEVEELTKDELDKLFKESPYYGSTANDIDPYKRNSMQSVTQLFTSHSISSTVNLPSDVDTETVSNIYLDGYKKGLKGQTVYRDGSRSGVLVSDTTKTSGKFDYTPSIKRPKELDAVAHTVMVKGVKYAVFVGFMENKPFEVFVYEGGTTEGKGRIVKEGKKEYYFTSNKENARQRIITDKMTPEQSLQTRLISGNLRHGRHFKYIIDDMDKVGIGIFDWSFAIKKVLAKYMTNNDVTDKTCPVCSNETVVYEEGCKVCKSCGWSACG